jgi:hypothetical protein
MAIRTGFAEDLPASLIFSFRRVTVREDRTETLAATAYYRARPHLFCLDVSEPVRQFIWYAPKDTLAFYPESRKAIRVEYAKPQTIAEEREFGILASRDKGLSAAGYRMKTIEADGDGAESVWSPPPELAKSVREVRVKTDAEDRIVSMETTGLAGKTIQKVLYSGYNGNRGGFPAEVTTRIFLPDGSVAAETRLSILSAEARPVPERISGFRLPDDVVPEVLAW